MEIGSEFWKIDLVEGMHKNELGSDYCYLLSGRTAIDHIIKDIKITKELRTVYMPSYCCQSMLQPFLDNNVDVGFYEIGFQNGSYTYDIDYDKQCDAILIMQYFGYENAAAGEIIKRFKDYDKVVIEDATHSWFSKNPFSQDADYVLASLRKWTGVASGAIALKQKDNFSTIMPRQTNQTYLAKIKNAKELKRLSIEDSVGQKNEFRKQFREAEELLECDYSDYVASNEDIDAINNLDICKIINKRRDNAEFLINSIKNIEMVETINISVNDTPLFVPIFIKNGQRDELQNYLSKYDVYCPIHWPVPDAYRSIRNYLYESGISLVCDQRYAIDDMRYVARLIKEFFEK